MRRREIVTQLLRVSFAYGGRRVHVRFPVDCGVDTLIADSHGIGATGEKNVPVNRPDRYLRHQTRPQISNCRQGKRAKRSCCHFFRIRPRSIIIGVVGKLLEQEASACDTRCQIIGELAGEELLHELM